MQTRRKANTCTISKDTSTEQHRSDRRAHLRQEERRISAEEMARVGQESERVVLQLEDDLEDADSSSKASPECGSTIFFPFVGRAREEVRVSEGLEEPVVGDLRKRQEKRSTDQLTVVRQERCNAEDEGQVDVPSTLHGSPSVPTLPLPTR
jgi:hypothetical protein